MGRECSPGVLMLRHLEGSLPAADALEGGHREGDRASATNVNVRT